MALRECDYCGHETDTASDHCSFCKAPGPVRTLVSARTLEMLKWAGLLLLIALLFRLAMQ